MCATFQLAANDVEEIHRITRDIDAKYGEGSGLAYLSHDFFPKQAIPVVGPGGRVSLLQWGFPMKNSTQVVFNARAEGLREKPMFRPYLANRCLIPATLFYEWDKSKKKFKVAFKDSPFFYMAGLWKREQKPDGSKVFYTTIITTAPNSVVSEIHNRMPAIIAASDMDRWLNGSDDSLGLLQSYETQTVLQPA